MNLQSFVRSNQGAANLQTVELHDLINHIKADTINLIEDTAGNSFVHIRNSKDEQYFTIKVSPKAAWSENGSLKELIDNNVIYAGENTVDTPDGQVTRPWLRYSRRPMSNDPIETISVADLFKKSSAGVPSRAARTSRS